MTNSVVFSKPYFVEKESGNLRLCCDIVGTELADTFTLWYEVGEEFRQGLCANRVDAFVIGMLPYIMAHSDEKNPYVVTSDAPISAEILYKLNHSMIPALEQMRGMYNHIALRMDTDDSQIPNAKAVGTGVSGGVDSFYSVITNLEEDSRYKVTHGLYCDFGIYGDIGGEEEDKRYKQSEDICNAMDIIALRVRSNILKDVYHVAHDAIVTFMFGSAVLALQGLFSAYHISSTYSLFEFKMDPHASSKYDLLNVYCMSNENLKLLTTGAEASRIAKVKRISDHPVVQKLLNVCVKPTATQGNCSRCSKCTRTMLELYVNGDLEKFSQAFDIEQFKKDPNYYFGYLCMKGRNDSFAAEIFETMDEIGMKLPRGARLEGFRKFAKNGFHHTNPLAKEYRP